MLFFFVSFIFEPFSLSFYAYATFNNSNSEKRRNQTEEVAVPRKQRMLRGALRRLTAFLFFFFPACSIRRDLAFGNELAVVTSQTLQFVLESPRA